MLNILICLSAENQRRIEDEFSKEDFTIRFGYDNSREAMELVLSKLINSDREEIHVKLVLYYCGEREIIDLDRVTYIQIKKRIVRFFVDEQENSIHQTYATLKDLERGLRDFGFIRVNKSQIVSVKYIESYTSEFMRLKAGKITKYIRIGRRFKRNVTEMMRRKTMIQAS